MAGKNGGQRKPGSGAVELTEQDLDQVTGATMLASEASQAASVTVRGWDPTKKKAIVGNAE